MSRHASKREWDRRNPRRGYKRRHEQEQRDQAAVPCRGGCGTLVSMHRAERKAYPGYCQRCALSLAKPRGCDWSVATI